MESDLISIIIPIYNAQKYLKECIDSALNQTYKEIEIILIDDGSTDYSGKICDSYAEKDKRVKVIHNENQGVSVSRNIGIKEAKGLYITFMDADDFVSEQYVEILYRLIKNDDSEVSIIGNDEQYEGKIIKRNRKIRKILNSEEIIKMILEEKYLSAVCWGKMYRKELFKDPSLRFDQDIKIGEDLKLIIPILEKCKKISIDMTQNLYHYRLNEDSITQQTGKKELWIQEIKLSKEIMKWVQEKYPRIKNKGIQRYVRVNITFLVKMIKEKSERLSEEITYVQDNVRNYKFTYFFRASSKIQDKIKLILILFWPKLLIKLYHVKDN